MRIGIVGSGIAGLVSAWLFSRNGHEVVLYEKNSSLGLNGAAVDSGALPSEIDVPLRLFNSRHWRLLSCVYKELGIEAEPVSATQSFIDREQNCYLKIDVKSLFGVSISNLLNQKPRQILQQAQRLRTIGLRDWPQLGFELQFQDYLKTNGFTSEFANEFVYPILSATVCTCSVDAIRKYPARLLLGVMENITSSSAQDDNLYRVRGGSGQVATRISDSVADIRTSSPVISITRHQHGVTVTSRCAARIKTEEFDHVVIATQANHADSILTDKSELESEMLGSFNYENVEVVVHSDESFLPRASENWSTFNFATAAEDGEASSAMCSIWLNGFSEQYASQQNFFQTINPLRKPDSEKVIAERRLNRPIVNQANLRGWSIIDEINSQSDRNVWFVGSYAAAGVPLLETGVESAIKVAAKLGADVSLFDEAWAGLQTP